MKAIWIVVFLVMFVPFQVTADELPSDVDSLQAITQPFHGKPYRMAKGMHPVVGPVVLIAIFNKTSDPQPVAVDVRTLDGKCICFLILKEDKMVKVWEAKASPTTWQGDSV